MQHLRVSALMAAVTLNLTKHQVSGLRHADRPCADCLTYGGEMTALVLRCWLFLVVPSAQALVEAVPG